MSLIYLLVVLVIVGLVLYLIENYVPMSPPIKTVLRVVVVLVSAAAGTAFHNYLPSMTRPAISPPY